MLEVSGAVALSIFFTVTLFFALYLISYGIVVGALFTGRKIKQKWKEGEEDDSNR